MATRKSQKATLQDLLHDTTDDTAVATAPESPEAETTTQQSEEPKAPEVPEAKLLLVPAVDLWPSAMNPRKHFDEEGLRELSESIRQQGILQPIVVRKKPGQVIPDPAVRQLYEVVCGARRSKAAELISKDFLVPVIVRHLTDDQAFELMITENLQRKDINPMEEARAFKALHDRGMKQQEIADRFGKSHVYVYQCVELSKLAEPFQKLLESGKINKRVGLQIAKYSEADQLAWHELAYRDDVAYTEESVADHLRRSNFKALDDARFPVHGVFADPRVESMQCTQCKKCTSHPENEYYGKEEQAICTSLSCFTLKTMLNEMWVITNLPKHVKLLLHGYSSSKRLQEAIVKQVAAELGEIQPEICIYDDSVISYSHWSNSGFGIPEMNFDLLDLNDMGDAQAYWKELEDFVNGGCKLTKDLPADHFLVYEVSQGSFEICRKEAPKATGKGAAASAPATDPDRERKNKIESLRDRIKRNKDLAMEKAYEALTKEIGSLALYGKLDHLEEQPPLTDSELLLFVLNTMNTHGDRYSREVQKLLNSKGYDGYWLEPDAEKVKAVMHRILPWVIRKHIYQEHKPAEGKYAGKVLNRWLDVARDLKDTNAEAVIAEFEAKYAKRNEKLQKELEELQAQEA